MADGLEPMRLLLAPVLLLAPALAGCAAPEAVPREGGQDPGFGFPLLPPAPPEPRSGTSWPQYGLDPAGTRHQAAERALTRENVASLRQLWKVEVAGAVTGTPAVAEGRVHFGSWDKHIYTVDAATGRKLWEFATEGAIDASPAAVGGKVYIGDSKGWLYKLDAATGREEWRTLLDEAPATHLYSSPLVHGDRVYMGVASDQESVFYYPEGPLNFHGSVVAVDAGSGEVRWRWHTQRPGQDGAGGSVWSSVVLDPATSTLYGDSGNAYTAPDGPNVEAIFALDARTGEEKWVFKANHGDVWTQRNPNNPDWDFGSSPVLVEVGGRKVVVAAQKSSVVWARDALTGKAVWQNGQPRSGDGAIASPAVLDGTLFQPFVGLRIVKAIALADGRTRWETNLSAPLYGAPAALPGLVLLGTSDGFLAALDPGDGRVLAKLPTERGGIFGGVSVAAGMAFTGTVPKGFLGKEGALVAWGP